MVVVFEFIGEEPIENIITCMNFKVDKVVYFGYREVIGARKKSTDEFLKNYCGVKETVYHTLEQDDLQSVIRRMHAEIRKEIDAGNDIYFDITGGECLILVAFGKLSVNCNAPLHMYDIEKNQLIELRDGFGNYISQNVPAQHVELNLSNFIKLKGGVIDNRLNKNGFLTPDAQVRAVIEALAPVIKKHKAQWNPFSDFLRMHMKPDENLHIAKNAANVVSRLRNSASTLKTPRQLNAILDDLQNAGLITELRHADGRYEFTFLSQMVKDLVWDAGSVLELTTYFSKDVSDDKRMVGVHLDWDGVIHQSVSEDVVNEVDVLFIKDNIPTFISCKTGKMDSGKGLHALYELRTVAERFGGKYAKMELVTVVPLSETDSLRAEEMKITVTSNESLYQV